MLLLDGFSTDESGLKKGIEKGLEKGKREGYYKTTISHLKALLDSGKVSLSEAMDLLQVPIEDRDYFTEQLQ